MQQQLFTFITHHWPLCLAFVGVLLLIAINEFFTKKQSPQMLTPQQTVDHMNHDHTPVIDIRDKEAYRTGHILGSRQLSKDDVLNQPKTSPCILVCARGIQATALAHTLRKQGFTKAMVLSGGITAWQAANLPLIKHKK